MKRHAAKRHVAQAIASGAAILFATSALAYTGLQTKLSSTNVAETVEGIGDYAGNTYINVIGTGDSKPGNQWGWSKDVVYDAKVHTSNAWFEPSYNNGESTGAWAGFKTTSEAAVTRIRYYARNDGSHYASRAIGLEFQGATDEEFTDAVTLYTVPDMDLDDLTNKWQEVYLEPGAKYTYFRIYGDYGGNLCEAEFYGTTTDLTAATAAPATPSFTVFAPINGKLTYGFTAQSDAYTYRVERRYVGEEDWETFATHAFVDEGTDVSATISCYLPGPADYRLVAVNSAGETASELQSVAYYKPLGGTLLFVEGEDAISHSVTNAIDGDPATYYKSSAASYWVGFDFGETKSVCGARLMPIQGGDAWLMEHDYIIVCDDEDFTTTISESGTLYDSWSEMAAGVVSNYTFTAISGRYARYYSSSTSRKCGVAEIELLTDDYTPDATPQNLAVSTSASQPVLTWDLPDIACMTVRIVRTTAPGGGTDTVTTDLRGDAATWTDSTAKAGVTYYYTVALVNNIDATEYTGTASEQVSVLFHSHIERDEDDQTQLRSGMSAYDSDGDGTTAMFDGSVSWGSWPDLSKDVKVGVDLGDKYVVETFEVYPRYDSYGLTRCNGMVLATDTATVSAPCEISTEDGSAQWYAFSTTNKTAASRFYLMRDDGEGFYGNVAELRLYGYLASDADSVLLAPVEASVAWKTWRVVLDWEECQNAATYTIERSTDGGEWQTVASDLTATEWTDTGVEWSRHTYAYRITSVGEDGATAISASLAPTGTGAPHAFSIIIR